MSDSGQIGRSSPLLVDGLRTDSSALGLLIDELAERIQGGEMVDLEAVVRDHPDRADELRRLLPALQLLVDVASSAPAAFGPGEAADDPTALTGTLGDYRLIREVGRGGMGIVYEAEQISLGRRVALKVLPYAATMDAKHLQRFKNEARAAAGLKHEHIVSVFAVGCERGVHFYSMEFIDGQTLAQMIAALHAQPAASPPTLPKLPPPSPLAGEGRGEGYECQSLARPTPHPNPPPQGGRGPECDVTGPYPPSTDATTGPIAALSTQHSGPKGREFYRTAAILIADAADALEHAHALGIVHRDVKPGNLLVDNAGKLYVSDFGLARFGPDAGLTASGDLLGTLRYMAPEQALARHGLVDYRADVYALGATLYELLTGRPVVDAVERADVLRQIAFEEPVPPRKLNRSIPAELETITLKALAKNPNERYATAAALADDLRRWLDDRPIRARRPSLRQRLDKWTRRHSAAVTATAAALLLGTTVSTWQAVRAWQAQQQAVTERDRAAEQEAIAQAVTDFLEEDVILQADGSMQVAGNGMADPNLTVKAALDRAASRIGERFRDRPKVEGTIRNAIGAAYSGLGDYRQAITHLERAAELAIAEFGTQHHNALAVSCNLATAYTDNDRPEDAIAALRRVENANTAQDPQHPDAVLLAVTLGRAYTVAGRAAEAIPVLERACEMARGKPPWVADTARSALAGAYGDVGRAAEAADLLQRVLDTQTTRLGPRHPATYQTMTKLAFAKLLQRRPDEAIALYEQAVQGLRATLGPDHPSTTDAMVTLAMNYTFTKPAAAVPLLEEAIPRLKIKPGPDHHTTMDAVEWLAGSYMKDRPADAAALYEDNLQRRLALHGPGHRDTLRSLSRLGAALAKARQWDKATALHEEWADRLREHLGPGHNEALNALRQYATTARSAGRPVDEVQLLEQALADARRLSPPDAGQVTNAALALAEALDNAGQWEKGVVPALEAVAACEQALGPDHADTLAALRRLEGLYRRAGRWDDDEAVLTELVKRTTAKLGPNHPDTLGARRDSAFLLTNARRFPEAIAAYERLRDTESARFGPGAPATLATLNGLAVAFHFAGRLDDADRLARTHVELQQLHNGPESAPAGGALALQGMNLLAQQRYADAEPVLRDAVRLFEKHPNADWQRGRVRNLLGAAVAGRGPSEEGERLLVEGFEAMKREEAKIPAPWKRYLADAGQRVVRYYEVTNQPEKAKEWREKLAAK